MEDLGYLENIDLDKSDLQSLGEKVRELKKLRSIIETKEEELKKLKATEQIISGEEIPSFLIKFGITSLKLEDGSALEVKEDLYTTLPKQDPFKFGNAINWLINNGGQSLVKDSLTMYNPEEAIFDMLKRRGIDYEQKQEVNANSLKAFFKDLLGMRKNSIQRIELSEIPKEFNIYIKKETKIK